MSALDELKKNLGVTSVQPLNNDLNKKGTTQPIVNNNPTPGIPNSAISALRSNLGDQVPVVPKAEVPKEKTSFWQKYKNFSDSIQQKVAVPFVEEIVAPIGTGIINTVGQAVGAIETINKKINPIQKFFDKVVAPENANFKLGNVIEAYGKKTDQAITDLSGKEKGYLRSVSEGFGSSIPFMIGGVAMVGAKVAPWLASIGSSGAESLINGYSDYESLIEKGDDEKTATKKALGSFTANLLLNYVTNKAGGFFETLDKGVIPSLKRFLTVTISETGQETAQQLISNITTGEKAGTGLAETALVSLPISAIFGTTGIALPNKAEKEFTNFIKEARGKGMNDEGIIKTISTLFGAKEENVRKAVEDVPVEASKTPAVDVLKEKLGITAMEQQKKIENNNTISQEKIGTNNQELNVPEKTLPKAEVKLPQAIIEQTPEKQKAFDELSKLASKVKTIEDLQKKIDTNEINNLEDVVQFHGTQNANFAEALKNGSIRVSEDGIIGKGFYLTSTPELADYFGKQVIVGDHRENNGAKPEVFAVDLRDLNIKKLPYGKGEYYDFLDQQKMTANEYNEQLKKEGYDGLNLEGRGETVIFDPKKIKQLDMNTIIKPSKKQSELVKEVIKSKPKSIKQIAKETQLLEPNVRRILGVGAKEGTFERIDKGVYVLSKDGEDMAWVETGDAMESLARLAKEGMKADMVFLDIPYDTPAIKGGSRGMNYNLISVADFGKVLDSVKVIARNDNSPVIHMFSQAPSGMTAMQKYNDLFLKKGFKPVGRGELQKTFKDGSPVTNVRGVVSKPEGILVFSKSGELNKELKNLDFKLVRPKGYQSEKPAEMLKQMIEMTTEEGDVVLDPFAGSGVTGAEAIKAKRKARLIEKDQSVVEKIIKPRIKETLDSKKEPLVAKIKNELPPHKEGESIGVNLEVEPYKYNGKEKGNNFNIPLEINVDGEIKYNGEKVADIGNLDLDDLMDKLEEAGNPSFIYPEVVGKNEYTLINNQIEDAYKKIVSERDQVYLDQYNKVFGSNNLSGSKNASIGKYRETRTPDSAEQASAVFYQEVIAKKIANGEAVVIGADNLKYHFGKDFDPKNHAMYSTATNMLYERLVREIKNPIVRFTVGGTGSGKSDFIVSDREQNFDGIIYDSTGWNYEGLEKQIQYAYNNKKNVVFYGIVPDVELARAYTFKREAQGEHPVSETAFIRTHVGAIDTMIKLIENGVDVYTLDTRGKTLDEIMNHDYGLNQIDVLKGLGYNEEYVKEQTKNVTSSNYGEIISKGKDGVESLPQEDRQKVNGSTNSSLGRYIDNTEVFLGNPDAIKPIQFPELVALSKELSGNVPFLKKYQKANGKFYAKGDGLIGLNYELFEQKNLGQLQKTLAHEIGHLVDYLPDHDITRGNLMGRLNTLNNFTKEFFAPAGATRSNQELKDQMYSLSKYWRPFEESTASKSYLDYRKSPAEIYADFISAMFNDPRTVSLMAPTAYNVFFQKLDMKPQVKQAYFELQDLLRNGDLVAQRRSATTTMFKVTEQEARERQIQDQIEKEAKEKSVWFKFKTEFVDVTEAIKEKVKQAQASGKTINPDDNPTYYLEERNYIGGKIKSEVDTKFNTIYQELQKDGMSWENLGELMFYERILKGDRQEIANPLGYQPEFVSELMDVYSDVGTIKPDQSQYEEGTSSMKDTLGEAKFLKLQALANEYRTNLKEFFKQGREEGIYNSDLEKMFTDNAFYVPFKGAKYSGVTKTSFTVKQQKGTLGGIENPANTGIEKAVSIIRAIERNKVTRKTVDFLQTNFSDEITKAPTDKNGYPIESRDKDLALITHMEDGKVKGYYVDKYIAEGIQKNSSGQQNLLIHGLRFANSKLFRPLFITFNMGFQAFNAIRDFKRFWKNIPNMTLVKATKLYARSARASKIRAFGLPNNPSLKDIQANDLINKLEKEQILSITYNDIIKGESLEDAQIDRILRETGVRETQDSKLGLLASKIGLTKNSPIIKQALGIMDFIEKTGNMIETLPKVAGVMALEGTMPPREMRSFVRKYVGSPDFLAGGRDKKSLNEIFLFSNAIFQGIRSDYEIATTPKTRGAFWLKTAESEIVPKLLMLMASAGLMGDWLKELFGKISEYDKANYSTIPLGIDQSGKAVYFRMPSDETGRLIGGLFWKMANSIKEPERLAELQTYTDMINYAGGQVPSITPTAELLGWTIPTFLAGNNPYDFFRSRNVLTDDQQQAGGMERIKPFLSYMFQQMGGGVFANLYTNTTVPKTPSLSEKIVTLPILSNIAGRFIKTSDYGEAEQIQKIKNDILTQQAQERLKNRKVVFDYVDKAQGKSYAETSQIKKEMIQSIYGGFPKTPEDRTQARNLEKRFDTLRLRGTADRRVDSLIIAGSNEEKVALLKEYQKTMSNSEFADLKRFIIKYRVVSSAVFQAFYRK